MSKGTIQIIESIDSIKAKINFAFREEVDRRMKAAAPRIEARVGTLVASRLISTPHARSILGGQLKIDFGLTDAVALAALTELIAAVKKSVRVSLTKTSGSTLVYSMTVAILPQGLSSVLSTIGTYDSNGHEIGWMKWLLTKGVEVVVEDYFVAYGLSPPNSRSGGGIMIKSGTSGRDFRVDPAFAGTEDDNFVVNTLKEILPEIEPIIRSYL